VPTGSILTLGSFMLSRASRVQTEPAQGNLEQGSMRGKRWWEGFSPSRFQTAYVPIEVTKRDSARNSPSNHGTYLYERVSCFWSA